MVKTQFGITLITIGIIFSGLISAGQAGRLPTRPVSDHRLGSRITSLPGDHLVMVVGNSKYYYHKGVYYRPSPVGYVVVAAPVGAVVITLPEGYDKIKVGQSSYFYYNGTFYRHDSRKKVFYVVKAPIDAVVSALPLGYATTLIKGQKYYVAGGVRYRMTRRNGKPVYAVTKVS